MEHGPKIIEFPWFPSAPGGKTLRQHLVWQPRGFLRGVGCNGCNLVFLPWCEIHGKLGIYSEYLWRLYIYIISIYKSAYMSFLGGPPAQTQGFWEHCEIRGPGNLEPWFEQTSFYHSLGAWSNFSSRCSSVISVVKSRTEIAFGYVGFNMWLAQ